jgi:hypothetical protein
VNDDGTLALREFPQRFYDLQTLAKGVGCGTAVCLVVAGLAAGLAIIEAVSTKPDVKLRLAEAAIFLAVAAVLVSLAVQTAEADFGWRRAHAGRLAPGGIESKFPW